MLAFLGGELSNSAKYFSSFGDVSLETARKPTGTYGPQPSHMWKPWKYDQRILVANKVEKLKKSLEKANISDATNATKVTTFIANQKSRQ